VRFDRGYGRLEAERRARPADLGAPPGPAIVAAAARQGVRIASVEQYRSLGESAPGGLVLGYGNLGDGEVDRAVAGLAQAVAEWSATG
jgi:DNA-binding transcriptional MocR family regulator